MRSSRLLTLPLLVLLTTAIIAFGRNALADVHCRTVGGDAPNGLQRSVEQAPLYRALAAASPVVACIVEQETGRTSLTYRFGDGGSLRVERDASSEYTNQEAWVGRNFRDNAFDVLKRAERGAFGKRGCGIDWRKASTERQHERPSARVSVYRGNVCNCQARIGHDEHEHVETLTLRSAC